MNKVVKVILIIVLFALLAGVRYFQEALFYDPLLLFFKSNFSSEALPDLIIPNYYLHLAFRFLINTVLSLAILWFLFQKFEIVKISAVIYSIFFVALMALMVLFINISEVGAYQMLFYTRRFLIQPLLLLLLIPAFYFIKK